MDEDVFSGISTHNLDQKNRLAIPSRLRLKLGTKFRVMLPIVGKERCIYVMKLEKFRELYNLITENAVGNVRTAFERQLFMNSYEVECDSQGRFTINPKFAEYAGLNKSVEVIGVGDRIEIWASDDIASVEEDNMKIIENAETNWFPF